MKATGIVRKIDDLGRIVIPKEIRKTLRIKEGTPLEIFTEDNGDIIFKKCSSIDNLNNISSTYAKCISKYLNMIVVITSKDSIIAVSGNNKINILNKLISSDLESQLENRTLYVSTSNDTFINLTDYDNNLIDNIRESNNSISTISQAIQPLILDSELIGSIILISKDKKIDKKEIDVLKITSLFIEQQLTI